MQISNPTNNPALTIAQAGLDAISTELVLRQKVRLEGKMLHIADQVFDLLKYKTLHIIGFGKVICEATAALHSILGDHIDGGIAIGTRLTTCQDIEMFEGSHPMPSDANVIVTKQIIDLSEKLDADDLVLVIVSGGGSSLLCWPQTECEQSQRLYQDFIKTNGTIRELNTLRKHISHVKGGGLAKILYPATIVGLVFSDVPGDGYDIVASGPTYFDVTTVSDAQAIADRYGLKGYHFEETPKDGAIFKKVTNIPIVSNQTALVAMQKKARDLGYSAHIISDEIYDTPEVVIEKMFAVEDIDVVLAGGEPSLEVPANAGKGGRNQHLALTAADYMKKHGICQRAFVALASDGRDNGDVAGVIVTEKTLAKAREQKLDIADYIGAFNSYEFFKKTGDTIMTGHTDANVSDLMILLNK